MEPFPDWPLGAWGWVSPDGDVESGLASGSLVGPGESALAVVVRGTYPSPSRKIVAVRSLRSAWAGFTSGSSSKLGPGRGLAG